MTWWKVETTSKKSVEEIMYFTLNDWQITYITGYRWGTILVESDEKPEFHLDQNDGVDMYSTGYDYELDSLDDGWFSDIRFSDNIPEEEQERLLEKMEEDMFSIEEEGWINTDTECWFYGDLEITET
jgi:hypothetical protein